MTVEHTLGRLGRAAIHPIRTARKLTGWCLCPICGRPSLRFIRSRIYSPEMAEGHGFSPWMAAQYEHREGDMCMSCGGSARGRHIARTLVRLYGGGRCRSLTALCGIEPFRSLSIAEINECAFLHQYLRRLPGLRYSEFGSTDPAVPSEDACNLSYADGSFDLVLTSDTLEHIPDFERALAEIRRVLRPRGYHVFTIPVVWDRKETRRRAVIEGGRVVHLMKPCYHGGSLNAEDCLAFYEYGSDVVEDVRRAGFEVEVQGPPGRPAVRTFVSRKV